MLPEGFSWVLDGRLGGLPRPGFAAPLSDDLDGLVALNVGLLLSLTERPLLASSFVGRAIKCLHLPITDFTPPTLEQIDTAVEATHRMWATGRAIAAHCAAGIGRTGTMLACLLVAEGNAPDTAVDLVRQRRPGSIETTRQEAVVYEYAAIRAAL